MQEHPERAADILARVDLTAPEVVEPAAMHHERLDGSGYPAGLRGEAVTLLGRIAGVADSYAAMITDNSRRVGLPPIKAAAELVNSPNRYDRRVCQALLEFLAE